MFVFFLPGQGSVSADPRRQKSDRSHSLSRLLCDAVPHPGLQWRLLVGVPRLGLAWGMVGPPTGREEGGRWGRTPAPFSQGGGLLLVGLFSVVRGAVLRNGRLLGTSQLLSFSRM